VAHAIGARRPALLPDNAAHVLCLTARMWST
jgi:hypothetical protein